MDPAHAVVWWEVDAAGVAAAHEQLERVGQGAQLVLRVTQQADAGPRTTEVPIDTWRGERLVALGEPGARHSAAVGLRADGFFAAIARAEALTAPQPRRSA